MHPAAVEHRGTLCESLAYNVHYLLNGKFPDITSSVLNTRRKSEMAPTNETRKKTLRSGAQRSLMSAPSGPVISGVNEVGMLSVTGYSRARPRGTELRARFA